MLINKIDIQNFCGISNLTLVLSRKNADIYGDNATGKTTIANAVMWLFTGKSSTATGELDPQPLGEDNAKLHNLETSVELETIDGGIKTTYKRTLSEVWTKKRGSKTEELTGCKTAYYIDGVPLKEGEYQAAISNIADSELFKILSVVSYFSNMQWQDRRKMLIDVCGDITDEDVINSNDELSELAQYLQNGNKQYTVEEYQRIAKSKKFDIKKEIDSMPARISELKNAMPVIDKDRETLESDLQALESAKGVLQEQLACDNDEQAKRQAIATAEADYQTAKASFISKQNVKNITINHDIADLRKQQEKATNNFFNATDEGKRINLDIIAKNGLREQLLAEYDKVNKEQYKGNGICPCCGQELLPEQAEKLISEFNKAKSEKLAKINARASAECHKNIIAELENKKATANRNVDKFKTEIEVLKTDICELDKSLDTSCFEMTEKAKELQKKIDAANSSAISDKSEITAKITSLNDSIKATNEDIAKYATLDKLEQRISELTAEKKKLGADFAHYENGEYLCETFIRTKVFMLDERINSKFKTLKFKLFHEQANGGLKEVCKVLIPCQSGLVEYDKANNAAKINAGLEIIDVLSQHYEVDLPVFVDNAESVTELMQIPQQVIRLVVSEQDKVLRLEV